MRAKTAGKPGLSAGFDGKRACLQSIILKISLAGNGHHDGAVAGFDVAFQMEDLLPGAQHRFPVGHRHGQGRPEQRRLQMRMAVAIVPGPFVSVVAAGRDEFVQQVGQVFEQARFVFDGAQRAGAADVEHVRRARAHAGVVDNSRHVRRQVVQLPVSFGFQQDLFLVDHALLLRGTGSEGKSDLGMAQLKPRNTPKTRKENLASAESRG